MKTELKTLAEIDLMRAPAQAASHTLHRLKKAIEDGERSLSKLESLAEAMLKSQSARPAFKGYHPPFSPLTYNWCMCASVNHQIVHAPPLEGRFLQEGDIVTLDMGAEIDGWYSDVAITVPVGDVNDSSLQLIEATEIAFWSSIEHAEVGSTPALITAAFSKTAKNWGFSLVRDLCGHGIGRTVHEGPSISNTPYRPFTPEVKFKEGVVICIEPMLCMGSGLIQPDGDWVIKTADSARAAHFEHVVAITDKGPQILSQID